MYDMFSVITTKIYVGLKRQVKLLQVTDMHITLSDDFDSAEDARQQAERRKAFRWDASLPRSEDIFDRWLEIAERGADCLLLTGDTIDAPSHGNIAYLENRLAGRSYLYVAGNHDWVYPKDFPPCEQTHAAYVPSIESAVGQSLTYQEKEAGEITLIGIDNAYGTITEEQFRRTFAKLDTGVPVVLCCHLPLYCETLMQPTVDYWRNISLMGTPDEVNQAYGFPECDALTAAYTEKLKTYKNLVAVVAGHIHFNHEDYFSEHTVQYTTQTAIHLPIAERYGKPVPCEAGQARWLIID